MTFEIKRRIIYTVQVGDKFEDLDSDQLRLKVSEAWKRIRELQAEIKSREAVIHECESFAKNAEDALATDPANKSKATMKPETGLHGITREKVEKVKAIIDGGPSRQWSTHELMAATGHSESSVRSAVSYLRSLRLVNEAWTKVPNKTGGMNKILRVQAKPRPTVPAKPQIPTVEHSVNQDLSAIDEEEKKRRIAMRES